MFGICRYVRDLKKNNQQKLNFVQFQEKFEDWDDLFKASSKDMMNRGISVQQRKYILSWRELYKRGVDLHAVEIPVRQKKYLKVKNAVKVARAHREGLADGEQSPFTSLVLLTRDKPSTSRMIDHLTPILNDFGTKFSAKSSSSRDNIINRDFAWAVHGRKSIVYNRISKLWQGKQTASAIADCTSSNSLVGDEIERESSVTAPTPLNSSVERSNESMGEPLTEIIERLDEDLSARTSEDFEFLELYLLIGWVFPSTASGSLDLRVLNQLFPSPKYGSPTIRPCSLVATEEFLYLANERFDLLIPPDYNATAHVNDTIIGVGSRLQPGYPSSSTASKGLVAGLFPPFSSPLIVGKIADIKRCERWRSWRFTMEKDVKQSVSDEYGQMITNGMIGICKSKTLTPNVDGSGRSAFEKENLDQGNAAGWEWWIKIVFSKPVFPENACMQVNFRENEAEGEYWWGYCVRNERFNE
ncbi:hypothetical protein HK098_006590 [Nowakowskiella sp. JEL0407]|nr:hypothetical protein HK098_006590 [Nowakowskiella sp. JEL0407]